MIFPPKPSSGDDDEWGSPEDPFQAVSLVAPDEASPLFEALARAGVRFRFEPTRALLPGTAASGSGWDKPFTALPTEECFLLEVHGEDLEAYESILNAFAPAAAGGLAPAWRTGEEPFSRDGSFPDVAPAGPDSGPRSDRPSDPSSWSPETPSPAVDDAEDGTVLRDIGTMLIVLGLFLWLVALFQGPESGAMGISFETRVGSAHNSVSWNASPWVVWGIASLLVGLLFRHLGHRKPPSRPPTSPSPGIAQAGATPPQRIVVIKCLSCGTHNPEDSKFCRQCGSAY